MVTPLRVFKNTNRIYIPLNLFAVGKDRGNDVKKVLQWMAALAFGFCVVNLLCFAYERQVGWFDTPNGPSPAGWNPGSVLVHGTEGYSVTKVDQYGYLNPDGVLQENYILCMGSSHTQGKEVAQDKKYTALVNAHFSKGEGYLAAYNIACDGNFLPSLIQHFSAAVAAFPDASTITIEISNTDFSAKELGAALQQVAYIEADNVVNQKQNLGMKGKLKNLVKEYIPLLHLMVSKWETAAAESKPSGSGTTANVLPTEAMQAAMQQLRMAFDGEIIFVYHPAVLLHADGTMSCSYSDSFAEFQKVCGENDIHVIDMGPIFLENYQQNNTLPYGFANTYPGNGHLNTTGHLLIAEALIQKIQEN